MCPRQRCPIAADTSFNMSSRKRHFSQPRAVKIAWQAHVHAMHATDLKLRFLNSPDFHLNAVSVLAEMQEVLAISFRQLLASSQGDVKLEHFFSAQFVKGVVSQLEQFYTHSDGDHNDAREQYQLMFVNELGRVYDPGTETAAPRIREERLGVFATPGEEGAPELLEESQQVEVREDVRGVPAALSLVECLQSVVDIVLRGYDKQNPSR